jgi:hypothetical protein
VLLLAGNYLDGTIPAELGDLSNLRVINLGKNGFTDVGLGKHRALQSLQLCSSHAEASTAAAADRQQLQQQQSQQQQP